MVLVSAGQAANRLDVYSDLDFFVIVEIRAVSTSH
jgi:hypothetical protein